MRSLGMASRNCCKVQAAVGWAVTLQCRMRRLPTSITTNTYSTRKPAVMATKKSAATKSMVDSHSHLKITGKEWDAFMDDFQQTLDKFAVPAGEQAELKAIVNSTRADIVVAPQASVA